VQGLASRLYTSRRQLKRNSVQMFSAESVGVHPCKSLLLTKYTGCTEIVKYVQVAQKWVDCAH